MTEKQQKPTKRTSHKCTDCGIIITNRFSIARGTCRACNDIAQQLDAFTVNDLVGDLELILNPSGVTQTHDYELDYAYSYK